MVQTKIIRRVLASNLKMSSGLWNFIHQIPSHQKILDQPNPTVYSYSVVKSVAKNMKWNSPWRTLHSLIRSLKFLLSLYLSGKKTFVIDFLYTKAIIPFQTWREFKIKIYRSWPKIDWWNSWSLWHFACSSIKCRRDFQKWFSNKWGGISPFTSVIHSL